MYISTFLPIVLLYGIMTNILKGFLPELGWHVRILVDRGGWGGGNQLTGDKNKLHTLNMYM